MSTQPIVKPHNALDSRLERANVFRESFGQLHADAWCDVLIRSMQEGTIDGVEFPGFPPVELQTNIHGHFGEASLREACAFYKFVKAAHPSMQAHASRAEGTYFLDFGSGWGRIARLFMRDFDLKYMFGYEPSGRFCAMARSLNPFIAFIHGNYLPIGFLPADRFSLIVGWSVFSHLSSDCAAAWLAEFERILSPGGMIVMTTWGERFLNRLIKEQDMLSKGEEINWYSKICIEGGGNLSEQLNAFRDGTFVWFKSSPSDIYGEAFISPRALDLLVRTSAPTLKIEHFDTSNLAQDVFVLTKP